MSRPRAKLLLVVLLFGCVGGGSLCTYPADIVELAVQNECEAVDDFYDRPGMVEPAFAYGFAASSPRSESVVFWCRSLGERTAYKLVAVAAGVAAPCSGVVYETKNYPGGLSLQPVEADTLAGFASSDGHAAPSDVTFSGLVVRSVYDGVGTSHVCLEGVWLSKRWD